MAAVGTPVTAAAAGAASPYLQHHSPAAASAAAAMAAAAASPHRHTPLLGHGTAAQTQHRLRRQHAPVTAATADGAAAPPRISSAAAAASTAPPTLTPLPPSQLSCHAALSLHLDDYVNLVDGLFHSLDPSLAVAGHGSTAASASASAAAAASAGAAAAAATSSDVWLSKLLRKDALLQESVQTLIAHQRVQRRLQAQYAELAELDAGIITFCSGLSALEQRLIGLAADPRKQPSLSGLGAVLPPSPLHPFTLHSLLRLSESLGRMSCPPSEYLEPQERFNDFLCRPPAPQDKHLASSLLRRSTEELVALVKAEAAAKEEAAKQAALVEAGGDVAMSDVSAPALGGRQESLGGTAAMPSFAELALQAGAGVGGTPFMMRQESAHRPRDTAPVALDLDLDESSSEEEDDD